MTWGHNINQSKFLPYVHVIFHLFFNLFLIQFLPDKLFYCLLNKHQAIEGFCFVLLAVLSAMYACSDLGIWMDLECAGCKPKWKSFKVIFQHNG